MLKTKQCYVGQSKHIAKRKHQHIHDIKYGKHHCKDMQKAFDKTGMQFFRFVVLETFDIKISDEVLTERERHWYNELSADLNTVIPGTEGTEYKPNSYKQPRIIVRTTEDIYPLNYADKHRPDWHGWVYGGQSNLK